MPQTPRITALINTYNYGRFVGEAIASVLAQDMAPGEMEVLVVDDGSTDDTAAVVAKFGERVRYIRKENGGQASALNVGFAEARGEIIATLDGDDLWLPGKVRRVLAEFEKHPEAGMVYHDFRCLDIRTNHTWDDNFFRPLSGYIPESPRSLLDFGGPSTSGIAVRRTAAAKVLPVPETLRIIADFYLGYLIIFVAPVVALPERLSILRSHGDNHFNFDDLNSGRLERRWKYMELGVTEWKRWLRARGFDLEDPTIGAFVSRPQLNVEKLRFAVHGARRREFFHHLRREAQLFRPFWSVRYRAFKTAASWAALLLGYNAYRRAMTAYGASPLMRLRKSWLSGK
jgi:glycosyltransferase involved in cell wall biosynthesis